MMSSLQIDSWLTSSSWSASSLLASGDTPNALRFDADLGLVTLVIFVCLFLVLTKFAWKPIMNALDQRDRGIADDIEAARLANEKAQTMLQQYESQLANARDEVSQMIEQAKADANATRERLLAEANDDAKRLRDRAVVEIDAAKDAAVRELAEKSVDSAVDLAGSLMGRELDRNSHRQLIDKSLEQFASKN